MLSACQHDATLRSLTTRALACEPEGDAFAVVLEDTVLYAEGGGQPADRGTVAGVPIVDVQRRGGAVVHLATAPVPLGEVEVVVDWARRLDHMQQHTGQHLLSALAQAHLGRATTAFHLPPWEGGAPPACDVELAGDLSADELASLEERANVAIAEARPVRPRVVAPGELAALGVRSRGVPDGLAEIRLVEIEGLDLNTCGGTHVPSTAWIGGLAILGSERMRGGTRVRYAAGGRARGLLHAVSARADAISRLLSVPAADQADAIERLVGRAKVTEKALKAARAELAALLGAQLAARPEPVLAWHRDDGDAAFLEAVASSALAAHPGRVLLLTAGEEEGAFLVAGPRERVDALGPAVSAILEARGGGRPGRFQGKTARLDRRGELASLAGAGPGPGTGEPDSPPRTTS